jgi:DNA-binding response OmpR family regulator
MLTARGEVRERVLGLDSGADDYLVKPFEVEELMARVNALVRRASGSGRVQVGPLVVDPVQREVVLDGKRLELTQKEFAIIAQLARRRDRVVPRTELLSSVWSTHFDPESNVVEVQVSRLRDKLGEHAWLIDTVRGRGYRLRSEPSR